MKKRKLFQLLAVSLLLCPVREVRAVLPDRVYVRMPESLGLAYRDMQVTTRDGYRLATWFFPAQERLSEMAVSALGGAKRPCDPWAGHRSPTIVICNGDAGNMSYFQLVLAREWTGMGFNVVTFDWRGFGASSPFDMNPDYMCYAEMLEDYRAVLDATVRQPEVRPGAVAVAGWSTGAYLSMIEAWRDERVGAFVGRSLATDFEDIIPRIMRVRGKSREQLVVPDDFPADEMPIRIAGRFTKPVFLIVGENDYRTPAEMSRAVLDALPAGTPRELMVVEGAAHGGREDPMLLRLEEFTARSADFLRRNLP